MTTNPNFLSFMQTEALERVRHWLDADTSSKQIFRLFGYAGTGKSTLAQYAAQLVRDPVLYLTYTGKAASVLRQKGCEEAQTLHSALYRPVVSQSGRVHLMPKQDSDIALAGLVILDECSMINDDLLGDLCRFRVPVLAMGDPAQLPPVNGVGLLASVAPDFLLTEVHRQAADNPILQLATLVRNGGNLMPGSYGNSRVTTESQLTADDILAADQIIVGTNRNRHNYNTLVRQLRGFVDDLPCRGERLVCLKNHSHLGISNGEIFTVLTTPVVSGDEATFKIALELEPDTGFEVTISISGFLKGELSTATGAKQKPDFDFGYALTCHKAQGSQWENVLVIDESYCSQENAKLWLYTAITRAQEAVTVAM